MIDTDKYDYKNIQEWVVSGNTVFSVAPPESRIVATNLTIQDAQLIADAPLLLGEVKRLQYRDAEIDRVVVLLTRHDWRIDSRDVDVHGLVKYNLDENKRLREYNNALLNWMMNHLDTDEDEIKEMIYE